jgi:hypothetical protein
MGLRIIIAIRCPLFYKEIESIRIKGANQLRFRVYSSALPCLRCVGGDLRHLVTLLWLLLCHGLAEKDQVDCLQRKGRLALLQVDGTCRPYRDGCCFRPSPLEGVIYAMTLSQAPI